MLQFFYIDSAVLFKDSTYKAAGPCLGLPVFFYIDSIVWHGCPHGQPVRAASLPSPDSTFPTTTACQTRQFFLHRLRASFFNDSILYFRISLEDVL